MSGKSIFVNNSYNSGSKVSVLFLALCVYYVSCLLVESVLDTFVSLHMVAGGHALVWHGSCKGYVLVVGEGCVLPGDCCKVGGSVGVPVFTAQLASLPTKEMENCRSREVLCLFSLILGRRGPFPGSAAMLSLLCRTAGPCRGHCLSDTEHKPRVVGSAKCVCVCVYGVGASFA